MTWLRLSGAFVVVAILWSSYGAVSARAADAQPLHARIDALIESAAVVPLPTQADDAEFLRRLSLDLNGVIPTAEDTRAFLADRSPNKRTVLVDRLLADPSYARWLSTVFDVTLMERRTSKVVKPPHWEAYLQNSFATNKPYDQLVRELLSADVVNNELGPETRFFIDRDVEPHLLTRDIGRIFFGMDMQCAQCHDHPIVDDYYQADYWGLHAFVVRMFSFTDKKDRKAPKLFAEKAEGEASFKSVFTGAGAEGFLPRLPKERAVVEPVVAKSDWYLVSPDKGDRPVPRYSRRQKLAELVSAGENEAFNKNIANRLWALMFGRGLVHPVDFMHPDNPASNPELLDLLAVEFRQSKYDIKWFLRELALTRAYQRSSAVPAQASSAAKDLAAQIQQLELAAEKAKSAQLAAEGVASTLKEQLAAAQPKAPTAEQAAAKQAAITKQEAAVKAATDAKTKAATAVTVSEKPLVAKRGELEVLAAAESANQAVIAKLPADKLLVVAAKQIVDRATATRTKVTELEQAHAVLQARVTEATAVLVSAEGELAKLQAREPVSSQLATLETALLAAQANAAAARVHAKHCEARLSDARKLVEYAQLEATQPKLAAANWQGLVDSWTERGYITVLKPLSPEQFCQSLMQASGLLAANEVAQRTAFTAKPPKEWTTAPEPQKGAMMERVVEAKTYDALRPNVNVFVTLYGGTPGQDFAATLNQALFFGNGTLTDSFIQPKPNHLVARLQAETNEQKLVDELYLSIFTRQPTPDETREVSEYLKGRQSDRLQALQEIVWGLLSSNEFRFNH